MKSRQVRNSLLLVLTAFIWGVAFVAQRQGGDAVGPFSFNGIRSLIGGAVLIPVIFIIDRVKPSDRKPSNRSDRKRLVIGGICCGTGLFLKKKCGWNIWLGIVIAVVGLYLLCMSSSLSFQSSDLMVLVCALLFAVHILVIDHFSPLVDGVRMSCIQFWVCGILSIFPAFFSEMHHSVAGIAAWVQPLGTLSAWIPILYAGVLSCGVAYTLQIVGQNGLNPTVASMIMSLESVFSVIAGWIILGERMGVRQLAGCGLIFAAILLAQIPVGRGKKEMA